MIVSHCNQQQAAAGNSRQQQSTASLSWTGLHKIQREIYYYILFRKDRNYYKNHNLNPIDDVMEVDLFMVIMNNADDGQDIYIVVVCHVVHIV